MMRTQSAGQVAEIYQSFRGHRFHRSFSSTCCIHLKEMRDEWYQNKAELIQRKGASAAPRWIQTFKHLKAEIIRIRGRIFRSVVRATPSSLAIAKAVHQG